MKVLVTGGFGYLGGRLARSLTSAGRHDVTLGSRVKHFAPVWLPGVNVALTDWNVLDSLTAACTGVDAVVHAAGMNAVDCAADPTGAVLTNGVGTARLLDAAIRCGVRRFLLVSTAHVYGSPLAGAVTEAVCAAPLHPYATSRRAAEDIVRSAHGRGDTEGIVIRLSNAYGAPAHGDANCWSLLVNDLCVQAVETNRMVLRTSGEQWRDFIAMGEACRAIEHLLCLPDLPMDPLFNVGEWSATVLEMTGRLAERVQGSLGRRPEISRVADRDLEPSHPLDYRVSKLRDTGFVPAVPAAGNQELDELIRFCVARAEAPQS